MSVHYIQFFSDGRGRAVGRCENWDAQVRAEPGFAFVEISAIEARQIRPHKYRFDLDQGMRPKTPIEITADKAVFAGDGKDRVIVTWQAGRPVNVRINGAELANNPHLDGLELTWDQAQRLRLEIDDIEFFGAVDLEAT